jgi:crotonobetainyl-CoA:carnitine CoA-transferase CaiB-like acyl-CoA transferase
VMEHPHVAARGMVLPRQDTATGSTPPMVAHPVLMDGQRPSAELAPPALGHGTPEWAATTA